MNQHLASVDEILFEALNIECATSRDAFLDKACGTDLKLRGRVEHLLDSYREASGFLDTPAVVLGVTAEVTPIAEKLGCQIGPYKLLQQIGEGGMGVVYMAEQTEPVERRVALKIIKPGMDTQQVIARFEAERQALALMDHPNIAKVLDAGATDSGRPYFVMELVKGIPVTQYCDQEHLSVAERLELFLPICQAIQHAHQKGIIHRDIKPTNILVARYDGKPVPKVIDFGVAKATSHRLTEKTMFTRHGQIVGTIEYMSPEQAEFNQLDIDTRSDIYSLGVLLYELLTGETPFDKQRLRSAALDELVRIIREEEPPKPSTKLSSSTSLANTAVNRKMEPKKLSLLVRGDLDWIVMKALEKDRNRRYETATSFANDIQRYLCDEPVDACPPSAAYRFRKFARRNKVVIATTAAIAASLIAGIITTSWQAYLVGKEAQRADVEAEKTRTEAAIAKAVNAFLNEDLLGMGDPVWQAESGLSPDPNIKLRMVLERAAENIEGRFADQPRVEAAIRHTVGVTYSAIGVYEKAEQQLEQALKLRRRELGSEHSDTLETMCGLAIAYQGQAHYAEAEELHQQTLEIRRRTLGDEHPDTLASTNCLAILHAILGRFAEAEKLLQTTLEIQQRILGSNIPDSLASMGNLANVYREQGRYDEAEELHGKVLEIRQQILGEEHPDTLASMGNLANVCREQGRINEAEQLHQRVLETRQQILGEEHRDTLVSMHALAVIYRIQGRYDDAEELHRTVLEIRRRTLGEQHPDTLASTHDLANVYTDQGRFDKAEELHQRTLEIKQRVLGEEHPETLGTMHALANVYRLTGRYEKAEELHQQVLEIRQRKLGGDHPHTVASMVSLAGVHSKRGCYAEAEQLYVQALKVQRQILREEHPDILVCMNNLAIVYVEQRRYAEAEKLLLQTLEVERRTLGKEHPCTLSSTGNLAWVYEGQGRYSEAEGLHEQLLEIRQRILGRDHPDTVKSMVLLALVHHEQGHFAKAESLYQQTLKILQRVQRKDSPLTQTVKDNFAGLCWSRAFTLATTDDPDEQNPTEAVRLAQQAVALDPTTANTRYILGVALCSHQEYKRTVEVFEKAHELQGGEDPYWQIFVAIAYSKVGSADEALQEYFANAVWLEGQDSVPEQYRFRDEAEKVIGFEPLKDFFTEKLKEDSSDEVVAHLYADLLRRHQRGKDIPSDTLQPREGEAEEIPDSAASEQRK